MERLETQEVAQTITLLIMENQGAPNGKQNCCDEQQKRMGVAEGRPSPWRGEGPEDEETPSAAVTRRRVQSDGPVPPAHLSWAPLGSLCVEASVLRQTCFLKPGRVRNNRLAPTRKAAAHITDGTFGSTAGNGTSHGCAGGEEADKRPKLASELGARHIDVLDSENRA